MTGGDISNIGNLTGNTATITRVVVTATTGVTSTNTGALQVSGGVGIGGGLYVGGVITATNISIGGYAVSTSSALTIQTAGVGQGTANTINFSTGLTATVATSIATVTLNTATLMTTAVTLANTTTAQVGYAANILGNGVANGSLLYQSAANTTAFLAQGTAGWIMVSGGSGNPPAFTNTASIYVNSAVNAQNLIGGAATQIPYQSSTGTTAFSSNLTFDPNTGLLTCVDLNTTSDATLKDNIATIVNPQDILQNLRGVQFNWKHTGQLSYGLIAQELEKTLPELVETDKSGLKSIRYLPIIGILLEAIKYQQAQINQLIEKVK
jgi:hypothetical protein